MATITPQHFGAMLDAITLDVAEEQRPALLQKFVQSLAQHGMLHRVPTILQGYRTAVQKRLGLINVVVTSPRELSLKEQKDILSDLPKNADAQFRVQPSLQFGIQIEIDGVVTDSSLSTRIQRLSTQLGI